MMVKGFWRGLLAVSACDAPCGLPLGRALPAGPSSQPNQPEAAEKETTAGAGGGRAHRSSGGQSRAEAVGGGLGGAVTGAATAQTLAKLGFKVR